MGLTLGDSIAIASFVFPAMVLIIIALIKKKNGSGNGVKLVKSDLDRLKEKVVYKDTFTEFKENSQNQFKTLHDDVKEIKEDIKILLGR